ncbi:MAG: DNA polymerase III subunit delta [Chloroflexi bacterium]|nr:DNA polymerase III subunit delta [Chloroflexota bacterium]
MIYLIYGEDDVSVEEAVAAMKANAGPDELRDVNVTVLESSNLTPEEVASAAFTIPFMADRRLVIVRGLLSRFERGRSSRSNGRGQGQRNVVAPWVELAGQLDDLPPTTDLVFMDGPLSGSNSLLTKLKPLGKVKVFSLPRDSEIGSWISHRAAKHGMDIEPRAVAALADSVGRQPRILDAELRKLALYRDGQTVRQEDVERMVAYVREGNIFQAVDAVVEGRTGDALRMARQITDAGQSASYVIIMIARQIRLLLLAKDMRTHRAPPNEIGKRLQLQPFAVNRALRQEGKLSLERLTQMHRKLVEADLATKTTSMDEQLALELLIAELSLG